MRVAMVLICLRLASALRFGSICHTSCYTTVVKATGNRFATELAAENKNFRDDFTGTRIFVQNLPLDCDWKQLKDHFKTAGSVVYASVSCDPVTKASKGHGIVQYETTDEATHALEVLNNRMFRNSELRLRADLQERRSADKTAIKSTHWSAQPPKNTRPALSSAVRPGDQPRDSVIKKRDAKKSSEKTLLPLSTKVTPSTIFPTTQVAVKVEKLALDAPVEVVKRRRILDLVDNLYDEDEEEVEVEVVLEKETKAQKPIGKRSLLKSRTLDPVIEEKIIAEPSIKQPTEVSNQSVEENVAGQHEFIRIKKNAALKAAKKASGIWTQDDSSITHDLSDREVASIQSVVMEREQYRAEKNFEKADMLRMALRRESRVQLDDSRMQWRVLPEKIVVAPVMLPVIE